MEQRTARQLFTCGILIVAVSIPGTASVAQELVDRIDEVTRSLMEQHKTPGVSIARIESNKIVWQRCYGVRRAGTDEPVTPCTMFEACSMSKPVFGYAVLKLVEQGKLELDCPLVNYLDKPYLDDQPLHKKITARMVLNHTTGFPNWRKGGWRDNGPLPVEFEPGTKFGYSGEGFWYLQQVVEEMVGETMEPWIQRSLLAPLKMNHSTYHWREDLAPWIAAGHTREGEVKTDKVRFERDNAAFSLFTTPTDYAKFLIEVMTADGRRPHSLTRESVKLMIEPVVATDKPDVRRSLGWAVLTTESGAVISHSGSNGTGFRCHSRFDPVTGTGVVVMTNAMAGDTVWNGIVEVLNDSTSSSPVRAPY